MNHNSFDEQIRQAIDQIEVERQPKSWELLEQRLNNTATTLAETSNDSLENQFDAAIREKIGQQKPAYKPNHWVVMSTLLDEYFSVSGFLRRYKILEIGLTVLFVFTCVNGFLHPEKLDFSKNRHHEDKQPVAENIAPIDATILVSKNSVINNKTISPSLFSKSIFSRKNNSNFNEATDNQSITIDNDAKNNIEKSSESTEKSSDIGKINTLGNLPQLAIFPLEEKQKAIAFDRFSNKEKAWKRSLTLFTAFDIDHVVIPDQYLKSSYVPTETQNAYNWSAGLMFKAQKKKWAFETGILLGKKRYDPASVRIELVGGNITTNSFKLALEKTEINLLQVPIWVRFDFFERKRFNAFLNFGATANVIMNAKYDYSRQQYAYLTRPNYTKPEYLPNRPYTDGFLLSNTLKTNYFTSANLGFGTSYKLSQKISISSQVMFKKHIILKDGIGPTQDRLHSTSFYMGIQKDF